MPTLPVTGGERIAAAIRNSPDTVEAYRQVLWVFGDREHGQQPGSFRESLLNAFCRADPHNFHRLEAAFPVLGSAVYIAKNIDGGMDIMRQAVAQ